MEQVELVVSEVAISVRQEDLYPKIDLSDKNNDDGYEKWFRGISKPQFLIAQLTQELFIYFSGCHLRYVRLAQPACQIVRTFRPRLRGQPCLLEPNHNADVYAIAETGRRPNVIVYKFEENPVDENIMCTLKRTTEFELRAMKFASKGILIILTGIPDFNISLWRWAYEEQLLVVNCLESSTKSDLLLNTKNNNQWVEVGQQHVTFYELQQFTDNNVIRSEVTLPVRHHNNHYPDPLFGQKWDISILSACYTITGEFYVLDNKNQLYSLSKDKRLELVGKISYGKATVTKIYPYENQLGGSIGNGLLIICIEQRNISIKGKIDLSSGIKRYFQFGNNQSNFYALTKKDKKLEYAESGKVRSTYTLADLVYRNIISACFIEPESRYMALLSSKGTVSLVDSETGLFFAKWLLPFPIASILCHPLLPFFAVGTRTGCMILLDIRDIKKPKVISRHFVSGDPKACLDKLAFIDSGFFLVAGDTARGRLYLQYGLTYGEFEYLDSADVPGEMLYFNVPPGNSDQRLQVVIRYTDFDECPVLLYNYTFDTHTFELVASQAVDIPIKSLCFSPNPLKQYVFHAEENAVGLVHYAEDLQSGGLKEPEVVFKAEFELDVNKMLLVGKQLYCFGSDGYTSVYEAPLGNKPKQMKRLHCIQSHMYTSGGIRDGIVNFDGTQIVTFGFDSTMVHIRIAPKPYGQDLQTFGIPNREVIVACQMTEFGLHKPKQIDPIVRMHERTVLELMEEADDELDDNQFTEELDSLWKMLKKLSIYMGKLIDFNQTRDPMEQLTPAEFNLDSDDEEMMTEFTTNAKLLAETTMTAINETRFDWANQMKAIVWDDFQVKGYIFRGFSCVKEVMNYPMKYPNPEFESSLALVNEDRRLEIKIQDLDDEIHKIGVQASKDVIQVLYQKNKAKPENILKNMFGEMDDKKEEDKKHVYVDDDEDDKDKDEMAKEAEKKEKVEVPKIPSKPEIVANPEVPENVEQVGPKVINPYDARFGDLPERLRPSEHAGNIISVLSTAVSTITDFNSTAPPSAVTLISELPSVEEVQTDVTTEAETEDLSTYKTTDDEQMSMSKKKMSMRESERRKKLGKKGAVDVLYTKGSAAKAAKMKKSKSIHITAPSPPDMIGRDYVDIVGYEETSDDDEYKELRKRPKKTKQERAMMKRKKKPKGNIDSEMGTTGDETVPSESTDTDPDEEILNIRQSEYDEVTEKELQMMSWFDQTFNGSLIFKLMKPNPLRYHQFDVAGRHHNYFHHILTLGEIIRLKTYFNKEFEEVRQLKGSVLQESKKRNKRIREILEYLKVDLNFGDLGWDPKEDSESFFTCKDREIPVQKWYSDEELKALELKREQEEEKRRLRASSFREKALYVMMDNKLVTRREDILKRDIPKPNFMTVKEEWEYNLEEYFEAQEYYNKVAVLEKQRAEFKKELEIELHHLIKENVEARMIVDTKAEELFQLKQKVEENVRMEEIRLCRMMRQVVRRSAMNIEENRLNQMLRKLQESLKSSQNLAAQLIVRAEKLNGRLDSINDTDRALEKSFRRDLGEVGNFFDFFMKSYKKRPKFPTRTFEKIPEVPLLMLQALQSPNVKSWGRENGENGAIIAAALSELDDAMQNPIGCPRSSWDRFVKIRRDKLVCEYDTKSIVLELMNLHKILGECKKREEELGNAMALVLASSSHERDVKLFHFHNFEFQMCYPQGRVELPRYDRRSDFYNAAIIKQQYIEKSNEIIQRVSAVKLEELGKNISQHSDLLRVEWRFKKAALKYSDIESTFKDMMYMRVSKEIIDFLHAHGNIRDIQEHRMLRLHKMQTLSGKYHKLYLDDQKRFGQLVKQQQHNKQRQNARLDKKINKMNLDVCEKVIDCDLPSPEEALKVKQQRIKLLIHMGNMMRKIHRYVQEIEVMERELARQCHKTFPIF